MKTYKFAGTLSAIAMITLVGCSTGSKSGKDVAAQGPTVLNARTSPSTFELDQNFAAQQPAEVITDVKDFTGKVTEVKLRFTHAPMEIALQNIGGTTWRAELTPEQLKQLAVSGQTMSYEANIIAKDEDGLSAVSGSPVTISIKAPDLSQAGQAESMEETEQSDTSEEESKR